MSLRARTGILSGYFSRMRAASAWRLSAWETPLASRKHVSSSTPMAFHVCAPSACSALNEDFALGPGMPRHQPALTDGRDGGHSARRRGAALLWRALPYVPACAAAYVRRVFSRYSVRLPCPLLDRASQAWTPRRQTRKARGVRRRTSPGCAGRVQRRAATLV